MAATSNQTLVHGYEMRTADGEAYTVARGGIADSKSAVAAVAAPSASAAIVELTAPGAGEYDVEVTTFQVGTVDTNRANMALVVGGTSFGGLLSTALATRVHFPRVTVPAATSIYVLAGAAAGGVGSVYVAQIVATKVA